MTSYIIILTTTPSIRVARKIANSLIRQRLAACVNIIPGIISHYIWQGKLCKEKEVFLLVKTMKSRFKKIHNQIKKLHPYQVPEIISLNIDQGDKDYLGWIKSLTK